MLLKIHKGWMVTEIGAHHSDGEKSLGYLMFTLLFVKLKKEKLTPF